MIYEQLIITVRILNLNLNSKSPTVNALAVGDFAVMKNHTQFFDLYK
jgi:hypothetical protein